MDISVNNKNVSSYDGNHYLRSGPAVDSGDVTEAFASIVTQDRKMLSIFRYVEAIAPISQVVMISGDTGTGKELIARAIHRISGRSGDFVSINIAGLDDFMFSDTLFGHARGAFTGADRDRKGLLEMAINGTMFLDEIGDLSGASQVKLLRLLQEKEYYSLGSDKKKISTARVVVATNSKLDDKIKSGSFRIDLYYRLCSHHIQLPSLRERFRDIPALVKHFMADAALELGKPLPTVKKETLDMLARHHFPGNVRELKGLISNAVALSPPGQLLITSLQESSTPPPARPNPEIFVGLPHKNGHMPTLKEAEEYLIREALRRSLGNQRTAAVMLGITRQALNKRLTREPSLMMP